MKRRRRTRGTLFRKYAVYFTALVATALLASGLVGLFFAYSDARALVDELQREKARGATLRIEQFARAIESQLRASLLSVELGAVASVNDRHVELLRLLQQAPTVVDVAWLDASARQLVQVSRAAWRPPLVGGRRGKPATAAPPRGGHAVVEGLGIGAAAARCSRPARRWHSSPRP